MSHAKTDEPVEMPFGCRVGLREPKELCIRWGLVSGGSTVGGCGSAYPDLLAVDILNLIR